MDRTYDSSIVLPFGAKVRMTSLDPYGLLGRENHPTESDVHTFVGTIFRNQVDLYETGDIRENERPGVATPEDSIIIYWVISAEGKTLELAAYEIEPV